MNRKNKNASSEMIPPQGGNACDLVRTTLDSLLEYHCRVKDSFTVPFFSISIIEPIRKSLKTRELKSNPYTYVSKTMFYDNKRGKDNKV